MQRAGRRNGSRAQVYALLYAFAAALGASWPGLGEAGDRLKITFAPEIGVECHYEITRSRQRSDGQRLERTLEARSRALLTPLSRNQAGCNFSAPMAVLSSARQ